MQVWQNNIIRTGEFCAGSFVFYAYEATQNCLEAAVDRGQLRRCGQIFLNRHDSSQRVIRQGTNTHPAPPPKIFLGRGCCSGALLSLIHSQGRLRIKVHCTAAMLTLTHHHFRASASGFHFPFSYFLFPFLFLSCFLVPFFVSPIHLLFISYSPLISFLLVSYSSPIPSSGCI